MIESVKKNLIKIEIKYNLKIYLILIIMLYLTCPTCGYFLGNKVHEYNTKKASICNNPKIDEKDQEKEIQKVLNGLKLRRYCCRMRMMTYKDMVEEILPVELEKEKK